MGKSRKDDASQPKRIKPIVKSTGTKKALKYVDPEDCIDDFSDGEDYIDEDDNHIYSGKDEDERF